MSEEKHASVFIKVALYLFDVGSDWATGGILLSDNQLSDFNGSTNVATVNGTVANDTIARCLKATERHLAWGVMTIAMSWIPATFAMFILIPVADGMKQKISIPLRFILWPLLVPVYMISSTGYLSKKVSKWITGREPNDDDFRESMVFKSMEGPLEAAPQLSLQLYIITRAGLRWSLGDSVKIVSMAFSTITIHMATVDGANFYQDIFAEESDDEDEEMQTDKMASFKKSLYEYIKQAPFNLPTILFKTGTLAIIFSTLKYGGVAHGIALVVLPWIACLIFLAVNRDDFTRDHCGLALLAGLLFLSVNTFTTLFPKKMMEDVVWMFRIYTWVGYTLNVAGLAVCYILTEMERKGAIHPKITFHCETNDWMRANLHIVCITLAALGLLSCILTEVFLLRKPKP